MKVLAFDQATVTGWAFAAGPDARFEFGRFSAPKRDDWGERLLLFRKSVITLAERFEPELISYEEPYWPRPVEPTKTPKDLPTHDHLGRPLKPKKPRPVMGQDSLKLLQRIAGVLQETCAELAVPCESHAPMAWRMTALGFGRKPFDADDDFMKKAMIAKAKQWGYDVGISDEADAIGILYHALHGAGAQARAQGDLMSMIMGDL